MTRVYGFHTIVTGGTDKFLCLFWSSHHLAVTQLSSVLVHRSQTETTPLRS